MNFLADESVEQPIVDRLRQEGYPVLYIAEIAPSVSDDVVLSLANDEKALLLTADKDFGELVFRQRRVHLGVVLIRLAGLSLQRKVEMVVAAINEHLSELPNSFTVISPGRIRLSSRGI